MIEPLEMTEQTERELGARLDSLAGSGAAQRFLAGLREKADGKLRTLNFSPALLARMAGQALAFRLTVPALAAEIARLAPAATAPGASGAASAAPAWCYDPRRPAEEVGALMPLAKQEYLKDLHARQNYALAQLGQTVQPAPEITFDSVAQRVSSAALETACEMNERKIAALTARHKPAAPTGPTAKESAQAVWNESQGLRGLERAEFFHARESELADAGELKTLRAAQAEIKRLHKHCEEVSYQNLRKRRAAAKATYQADPSEKNFAALRAFDTLDKESDERRARAAVGTIKEALRTARRNTAPLVQTIRERAAAIVAAEIAAQASAEETSSLRIGIPFVPSHRVGALQLLHKQFTDPIFPNNCEPRNQLHGLITF